MPIWIKVYAQEDLRIQLRVVGDTLSNCQRKKIQGTNEADEDNLEISISFWTFKDFR